MSQSPRSQEQDASAISRVLLDYKDAIEVTWQYECQGVISTANDLFRTRPGQRKAEFSSVWAYLAPTSDQQSDASFVSLVHMMTFEVSSALDRWQFDVEAYAAASRFEELWTALCRGKLPAAMVSWRVVKCVKTEEYRFFGL